MEPEASSMLSAEIINDGLLEGDTCVLCVSAEDTNFWPITLHGTGMYQTLAADAPMMRIEVTQLEDSEDELIQSQEEMEQALAGWLTELGFYAMPRGIRASVQYTAGLWEDDGSFEDRFVFGLLSEGDAGEAR